jgi:mRNA interferase MazF
LAKPRAPRPAHIKHYPFEVSIDFVPPSVVLADQVKSLDWRREKAVRKGSVSAEELADVRAKIRASIG